MRNRHRNRTRRKTGKSRETTLPFLLRCVTALALSGLVYYALQVREARLTISQFREHARTLSDALKARIENSLGVLTTLSTAVPDAPAAGDDVYRFSSANSRDLFQRHIRRTPALVSLYWAPVVRRADRGRFERMLTAETGTAGVIQEANAEGRIVTAGSRERYCPVLTFVSSEECRNWIGLDLEADEEFARALADTAAGSKTEPRATSLRDPVAELHETACLEAFVPVYSGIPGHGPRGFLGASISLDRAVESALQNLNFDGISFLVYEGATGGGGTRLAYSHGPQEASPVDSVGLQALAIRGRLNWDCTFAVGGRRWVAVFFPSPGYPSAVQTWHPLMTASATGLLTFLVLWYMRSMSARERRARRLAIEHTKALTVTSKELAREKRAKRDAHQRLRESEQRYRLLAENSTDMISRLTREGIHTYVSPACRGLLRREPEEVVGCSLVELAHPDDRNDLARNLEGLEPGNGATTMTYQLLRGDGKYAPFETTARALADPKDVSAGMIVATSRDITERRQLEEGFLQAQKMEVVGRLAGGIAHDFNNYLTVIQGFAEIIRGSLKPESEQHTFISEILDAARSSASLVKQLLAFARKQKVDLEGIPIDDALRDMTRLLQTTLGEDVQLQMELRSKAYVEANMGQLKQVITNMAVNSRDAMPAGGTFTISTGVVKLGKQRPGALRDLVPGDYVLLSVRDTGCGMSAATKEHAFEPFYTTKDVGKGTGLGLATAYGIVKQWDGEIVIHSKEDAGTDLLIYLSRASHAAEARTVERESDTMRGTESILVVEDDDRVRTMSVAMLRRMGYRVLEARDGQEALETCRRSNGDIDLVFSDVVMPRMGGVEFLARLRAEGMRHPVVLASGYQDHPGLKAQAPGTGVCVLAKPFSKKKLGTAIRETLAKGVTTT